MLTVQSPLDGQFGLFYRVVSECGHVNASYCSGACVRSLRACLGGVRSSFSIEPNAADLCTLYKQEHRWDKARHVEVKIPGRFANCGACLANGAKLRKGHFCDATTAGEYRYAINSLRSTCASFANTLNTYYHRHGRRVFSPFTSDWTILVERVKPDDGSQCIVNLS